MGKDYQHIEEFLEDQSFRRWVLEKDDVEGQYWEKWIKANSHKEQLLLRARRILLDMMPDIGDWEKDRKEFFLKRLDKSIEDLPSQSSRPDTGYSYKEQSRRHDIVWPRAVVWSLLLVIATAWLLYEVRFFGQHQGDTAGQPIVEKEAWTVKSVPIGQKSKLHLPDGSIITLNSSSEIRYKAGFGVRHREIFLEGESFFEVAHDSLLPFRVFAGDVVTTALGTSFNIRNYDPDEIRVQLATGLVEVHKHSEKEKNTGLLLEPGEEALWKNQEDWVKRKFDLRTAFLWKDGVIYLQETPFSEVIRTLEKWYGVKIHVKEGSHNNRSVSGEFKNDYLSNVLETINYTMEFDYKIKGKDVEIFFKNK